MLISVDPGVKSLGVAAFEDGELAWAELIKRDKVNALEWSFHLRILSRYPMGACYSAEYVIEKPQVYVRSRSKGDPNDLIDLAIMAGAVAATCRRLGGGATFVKPAVWKGQVPKAQMTARIKKHLSAEEIARVELPSARSLQHNVWDAVGIGLNALKRL